MGRNTREWCDLYIKEVISNYNPKFKIRPKEESKLFKFFAPLIKLINPKFFSSYTTTMFGVMWVTPTFFDKDHIDALEVTAHEGRHEYDKKRLPWGVFELLYSFPQVLALIFVILSIFLNWWFLFGLVFLGPLPAPWRYHFEMKGYTTRRMWARYVYGLDENTWDDDVVELMSSLNTYYMAWPFKKWIKKDLQSAIDLNDPGYMDVMEFLKRHNLKRFE